MPEKIILRHQQAPGDIVVMTALVRDIRLQYKGEIQVDVRTPHKELWENNPYLTPMGDSDPGVQTVYVYKDRRQQQASRDGGKFHYLQAFHKDFERLTGIHVDLMFPKPNLHLSFEEVIRRPAPYRYWVVMGGGKSDFTTKHWVYSRFAEVVAGFPDKEVQFVQLGKEGKHGVNTHTQPRIDGTVDMVGQTDLRQFLWWIYHSEGVLCPVTAAMHIAAAFDKPCVVLAGGREDAFWEHYANGDDRFGSVAFGKVRQPHEYLSMIGQLPCCETKGCWKRSVTDKGPMESKCELPLITPDGQNVAQCMDMISAQAVLDAMARLSSTAETASTESELLIPAGTAPTTTMGPSTEIPRRIIGDYTDDSIYDNAAIGGGFTIYLYATGNITTLTQRCLTTLRALTTVDRYNLVLAAGNADPLLVDYLRQVAGEATVVEASGQEGAKYAMMRSLLRSPETAPRHRWFVWMDHDCWTVSAQWLYYLAETIINARSAGARLFGAPQTTQLRHALGQDDPRLWFQSADWYAGKDFRTSSGVEAANGDKIVHVNGAFFVAEAAAMLAADAPDARLLHNGGAAAISEQLHQKGFSVHAFDRTRKYVFAPSRETVSYPGPIPWY